MCVWADRESVIKRKTKFPIQVEGLQFFSSKCQPFSRECEKIRMLWTVTNAPFATHDTLSKLVRIRPGLNLIKLLA